MTSWARPWRTAAACFSADQAYGIAQLVGRPVPEARALVGAFADGEEPPLHRLATVAARADAVLDQIRPLLGDGDGDVAVVAHGHLARVLAARWLGLDASAGRLLGHPHPCTLSFLATEGEQPFISAWNVP